MKLYLLQMALLPTNGIPAVSYLIQTDDGTNAYPSAQYIVRECGLLNINQCIGIRVKDGQHRQPPLCEFVCSVNTFINHGDLLVGLLQKLFCVEAV
jgi:hypothetical protein